MEIIPGTLTFVSWLLGTPFSADFFFFTLWALCLLQRERNTSYHRRWFVLKGNLLFYQERPADRHLLGVIVLEGCIVQPNPPEGQFCFSLVFTGPGLRTYGLAADDCLGQESWVHALHSASHTCLSLLVKELGRLYEGERTGYAWTEHIYSTVLLQKVNQKYSEVVCSCSIIEIE